MAIQVDCDFPGGNICVERIEGDEIYLHQDLRDTARDWFYSCFRIKSAAGKTLRFTFTKSRAIGVRGPAISLDGGESWSWLGQDNVDGNSFTYSFPTSVEEVRFSFGMPYQDAHWQKFVPTLVNKSAYSRQDLGTTEEGRRLEYMVAGNLGNNPLSRVAVTCRHHCCEMIANYTLEGLIRWTVDDPGEEAQWLRDHVQFLIVPFVDKDGVENGDQGKQRRPRDHGRDYSGKSLYKETEAIKGLISKLGDDRLRVGIDLHCPYISGGHSEDIYLVGSKHDSIAKEQRLFSRILESVSTGILPFCAADFLPFGESWNREEKFIQGESFPGWLTERKKVPLATTIEIPYANARGVEVNQDSARSFGRDLGMAIASYLSTKD